MPHLEERRQSLLWRSLGITKPTRCLVSARRPASPFLFVGVFRDLRFFSIATILSPLFEGRPGCQHLRDNLQSFSQLFPRGNLHVVVVVVVVVCCSLFVVICEV